jgi:membrane protein
MEVNYRERQYKLFNSSIHKIGKRMKKVSFPGFEKVPIYHVFWFFVEGLKKGSLNLRATSIAFNFLLALGPALIFFLTLLPYLPIDNFQENVTNIVYEIIPTNSFIAIEPLLKEIFQHRGGLSIFGFILSIFFAQKAINGIIEAFNATSHNVEGRSWHKQRLISIGFIFIFFAVVVSVSTLFFFSRGLVHVLAAIGKINVQPFFFMSGKWIVLIAITFFGISFLYYLAPGRGLKRKFVSAGSSLATVLTIIASLGFTYFMDHFAQLNKIFGTIGAIVALMLWMNFNALSLLIGFELNASINHARQSN